MSDEMQVLAQQVGLLADALRDILEEIGEIRDELTRCCDEDEPLVAPEEYTDRERGIVPRRERG